MFDHVGRKIMRLAQIMFWGGLILSGILGGMVFVAGGSDATLSYAGRQIARGPGWLVGSLFILLGCLSSWLCSMFVYAFGDLVEKTQQNHDYLKSLVRAVQPASGSPAAAAFQPATAQAETPVTPEGEQRWLCPKCGVYNDAQTSVCHMCGWEKG